MILTLVSFRSKEKLDLEVEEYLKCETIPIEIYRVTDKGLYREIYILYDPIPN